MLWPVRASVCLTAVLFVLTTGVPAASAESPNDILVVVNPASGVTATTVEELRNLFLRQKGSWRAGGAVTPVNAAEGSSLRDRFRRAVLGMTATEEKEFWKNTKIRGGSTEPSSFNDTMKAVFRLRNGVSYVFRSQLRQGLVRVVLVIPAQ